MINIKQVYNRCQVILQKLCTELKLNKQLCTNKNFRCDFFPQLDAFSSLFPLADKQLLDLGVAANLYFWNILIADDMIDEENKFPYHTELLLLSHVLRDRASRIMSEYFSLKSPFWSHFDKYVGQYTAAVSCQVQHHFKQQKSYTIAKMEMIMAGLPAMAKSIITAMAMLTSRKDLLAPIMKSIDNYYIGKGLKDDIQDWREDYNSKRYSYTLAVLCAQFNLGRHYDSLQAGELGKLLFFSGTAESLLEEVLKYYRQALGCVQHLDCRGWREFINRDVANTTRMQKDISKIRKKELSRVQSVKGAIHV